MSSTAIPAGPSRAAVLAGRAAIYTLLICGGITMIAPFLWMLSSSLQTRAQLYDIRPVLIPNPPQWRNYEQVWLAIDFGRYFLNSCFVTAVVTTLTVIFSAMAGFTFAKYNFPGKRSLFIYFIATMMIPHQVTLIPLFLVFRKLNLLDTYLALILPALTSAFGIFMMRQFISGIPDDLLDSARIDGSKEIGLFARIVLPNIKPAASALAIFIMIGTWNDFLWPLIAITRDELKPIQVGLASLVQQHSAFLNLLMAGATCALAPVIIMFLVFQRQFVAGVVLSGVKE